MVLLNGPPVCGKSTLARMYVADHPFALNLDVDRVRGMLGRWREDPQTAGLLARAIALAAARTHLSAGHDVVIPQLLAKAMFLDEVEQLANEIGTDFHEVVLMGSKRQALRRFVERSRAAATPAHVEVHEEVDRIGGVTELSALYDRLVSFVATRPRARIVPIVDGQVDKAYRDFLSALS